MSFSWIMSCLFLCIESLYYNTISNTIINSLFHRYGVFIQCVCFDSCRHFMKQKSRTILPQLSCYPPSREVQKVSWITLQCIILPNLIILVLRKKRMELFHQRTIVWTWLKPLLKSHSWLIILHFVEPFLVNGRVTEFQRDANGEYIQKIRRWNQLQ